MDTDTKFYISLGACIIGTLITFSGDLTLIIIGTILSVGGAAGFYYYRSQRKVKIDQNALEVNALLEVQKYKDSQKQKNQ